eukprot:GHRR01008051.1.p1 GENE.GHRR01008051.1~~GHRR01008051.1.p1  ORF type:complete len:429 (+),score=108.12 GHRR01008051.1:504-1790(+)
MFGILRVSSSNVSRCRNSAATTSGLSCFSGPVHSAKALSAREPRAKQIRCQIVAVPVTAAPHDNTGIGHRNSQRVEQMRGIVSVSDSHILQHAGPHHLPSFAWHCCLDKTGGSSSNGPRAPFQSSTALRPMSHFELVAAPVPVCHFVAAAAECNCRSALSPQILRFCSSATATTSGATATAGTAAVAAVTALAPAVALDVEYAHLLLPDGQKISLAAWVALVDEQCNLLLKTYINALVPGAKHYGGVPLECCMSAPPLAEVKQHIQQNLQGKMLVGHNLAKDLAALGLSHPQYLRFDTMTHPAFQNRAGNSKNLKQLARVFLGVKIQHQIRRQIQRQGNTTKSKKQQQRQQGSNHVQQKQQGAQLHVSRSGHDPEEDAVAVMKLYQQVVVPTTYEGQVAAATHELLLKIQRQQRQQEEEEEREEEEAQ